MSTGTVRKQLQDARCVLAFDSGVEPVCEICMAMLSRLHVSATSTIRDHMEDVVDFVGESAPDLLIFHSNLLCHGIEAIETLVARSPNTRYLMLTGWPESRVETVCKKFEAARAFFSVLEMPFKLDKFAEVIGDILSVR